MKRLLTIILLLFASTAYGAVPVVESQVTATTGGTAGDTITFATAPSGLAVGDLIFIIGMAENQNTDDWNAVSGYTRIVLGDNAADTQLTFYWRISTGSDGFPNLAVTRASSDFAVGWVVRISGVDQTTPIDVVGTSQQSTANNVRVNQITTGVDDALLIAAIALDGSDIAPVNITGGAGWGTLSSLEDPTDDGNGVGGGFALNEQISIGSPAKCDFDFDGTGTDGYQTVMLSIAPGEAPAAGRKNFGIMTIQ